MALERYINTVGEWLNADGPHSDIVISSRVRLARNIEGIPFSHRAKEEDLNRIIQLVNEARAKSKYFVGAEVVELASISSLDRLFLIERHLISPELSARRKGEVIIGDKEILSLMVNEEDHLRVQAMSSGLQLLPAWQIINRLDDELSQNLNYAVSPEWGYLTACPTNVGTGMRASVMLHLPALTLTEEIKKMPKAISQLGLALRGFYGEGTSPLGDLFQISNQITLGQREEEIVDNIERITRQIIEYEKGAQESLLKKGRFKIEDRIYRAYGTLRNARIISSHEAMGLISLVRMGVRMGMLGEVGFDLLNRLLIIIQPAHIQKWKAKEMEEEERDIVRAELIRELITHGSKGGEGYV
jgi:protein arginine kinase